MSYDRTEQDKVMRIFADLLWSATADGGRKRARGEKPPWWKDPSHKEHIKNHERRYEAGERVDPDSKQHPGVHIAWRWLAIAYQETYGCKDPDEVEIR
jgi:hypothetical protein